MCSLIFRLLRWHDRSEILKGARQAYPVKCAQDNVTLLFLPDFSPATTIRRKTFNPVLKKMTALGLQPFLTYPAVIKLRHKGEQKSFDSPQKSGLNRCSAGGGGGRSLMAGMDMVLAAQGGWWQDGHGHLLDLFFAFSSPLSPTGILSLYIRYNDLVAGKTDVSPWMGLMESRFNKKKIYIYFFFGCVSLSGDMSCVGVDRSRTITIFCCSVRPMFSVMCGLNCRLFMFLIFIFLQQTFILLFILPYF